MTPSIEATNGVELKYLTPGSQVDVETKSRHYLIEALGGNAMRISGHPQFCPNPTLAELQGSADEVGRFIAGRIEPGKHLVFLLGKDSPVTTSEVVRIRVH
jgi:hypothetical protein